MLSANLLTSEMVRSARAMLRWEQRDLAKKTQLSIASIKRLELLPGKLAAQSRTVSAIIKAFEEAGVRFIIDRDQENERLTLGVYIVCQIIENDKIGRIILEEEDMLLIKNNDKKKSSVIS